jgi:K+-sensing histidine kinase KdpD
VSVGHVAIALPADPEVAQAVLSRGRRLARHLGLGWVAIVIETPSGAARDGVGSVRELVSAAGGRILCRESRDVAAALLEASKDERARLLVIGASRRPRFLRRLLRGTTERLLEAHRSFDIVVAGPGVEG